MDYVVGGVAALLTGNVTPNRPKLTKKARTPTKHQLSPNVTPKSELLDDRSIFLSPTLQKKKAVLKKSPKRIFENPDLDETNDGEGVSVLTSPKADKVKKHLKNELESETVPKMSPKSPKHNKSKLSEISGSPVHKKNIAKQDEPNNQNSNENTPKKKKRNPSLNECEPNGKEVNEETATVNQETIKSSKKKRKLEMETSTEESKNLELNDDKNNKRKKKKEKEGITKTSEQLKAEALDEERRIALKKQKRNMKLRLRRKRKQLKKKELKNQADQGKEIDDGFKEKKSKKDKIQNEITNNENQDSELEDPGDTEFKQPKPKIKKNKSKNKDSAYDFKSVHTSDAGNETESENEENNQQVSKKQEKKKSKLHKKQPVNEKSDSENDSKMEEESSKKSKKLRKKRLNQNSASENLNSKQQSLNKKKNKLPQEPTSDGDSSPDSDSNIEHSDSKLNKKTAKVNQNSVSEQDTDSEHDSDDDIDSENEQINKKIFNAEPVQQNSSSDSEQEKASEQEDRKGQTKQPKAEWNETDDAEVTKRTLFIGNVPLSKKTKKEIKRLFSQYGQIETVRIRTVPVKDGRVTPKMAVIKNELHPDRSTVNVYVKYSDPESVEKALSANNTILNDYHLRVSRAEHSGAHDASRSVFVGNLPFALEDDTLRAVFDKCGQIDSVRIIRDKVTNAGKGFGYVNFASKDGVELALALSEEDLTIKNRIIRVKRCAQNPQKNRIHDKQGGNVPGRSRGENFRGDNNQGNFQRRNTQGNFHERNAGGFQGRNQGGNFRGKNQEGGFQGRNQGGNQGGNKGGRSQGDRQRQDGQGEGAYRRIMKKREHQENGDGPPSKMFKSDSDHAAKEKKPRKEFVGMTADKKKKHKFNKGDKKKKVLSKILTKT